MCLQFVYNDPSGAALQFGIPFMGSECLNLFCVPLSAPLAVPVGLIQVGWDLLFCIPSHSLRIVYPFLG